MLFRSLNNNFMKATIIFWFKYTPTELEKVIQADAKFEIVDMFLSI